MSVFHKLVAGTLALLVIAMVMPASSVSAHCTVYHPHHCPEDIAEPINPSSDDYDQVYEFTLVNRSSETVYVAYGNYRPYSSRSGDLAVVTLAAWIAQGWWSVAPGAQQTLYRSYSDDHIYFRIQNRNGTITPRSYEDSAEFCTSSYGFSSTEMENQTAGNRNNFQITANGSRTSGATCAAAGGEWKTFYKMRAHMDFTVN